MAFRLRFMHFLWVVSCACAALYASPLANSQSPATATPQEQETQPVQQGAGDSPAFWNNPKLRHIAYGGFIQLIGSQEWQIEQALQEGKTPLSRMHLQFLGIREDEEQAIRTTVVDAYHQIGEIHDQSQAALAQLRRSPSLEGEKAFDVLSKELGEREYRVVDETIAKLEQELGDDITKLDPYVHRGWVPGMSLSTEEMRVESEQEAASRAVSRGVVKP